MRTASVHQKRRSTIKNIISAAVVVVFMLGAVTVTLGQQEENPPFIEELSALLSEKGWSEQEVNNLVEAAQELEGWEDAEEADPEVVALALELGKNEDQQMEPLEQAQLALNLALTAVEMNQLGYNERAVARAALNGARDTIAEIQTWKSEGKPGSLGELVRENVRSRIHTTQGTELQQQARERARQRSGGAAEAGFSNIPSGALPEQGDNLTGTGGRPGQGQ
ncbi:MAG: hypothetical protein ACOC7U_09115 [Spirochaetota bacterium]